MNAAETALMNNPVRTAVQRHYEARLLRLLGGLVADGRVLEVGCGRGVGMEIILDRFGAAHVDGFDLDPAMVEMARRRLAPRGAAACVTIGDVTALDAPDDAYDAVFDFGIIHHVPDWPAALDEVARVLRPGGRFFFEEVTLHALDRWSYRTFLEHPTENRFDTTVWIEALGHAGLDPGDQWVERFFGDFVIGVARRVDRG
jgi:ubiquinone/menaquinone biosynthesis C-methylase UbiE